MFYTFKSITQFDISVIYNPFTGKLTSLLFLYLLVLALSLQTTKPFRSKFPRFNIIFVGNKVVAGERDNCRVPVKEASV